MIQDKDGFDLNSIRLRCADFNQWILLEQSWLKYMKTEFQSEPHRE